MKEIVADGHLFRVATIPETAYDTCNRCVFIVLDCTKAGGWGVWKENKFLRV